MKHNWIDWSQIRVDLIEKLQSVEHGDLNWIIEGKFLAFAGPSSDRLDEDGLEVHPPSFYAKIFKKLGVTDVVRLNVANYHPSEFQSHGLHHHDLFFEDGSCPPPEIVEAFLSVVQRANGAIAVHCKAGLGRTASLIGLAVMQEYKVPAIIYIAWARLARPGSVIGPQQHFLVEMEERFLPKQRRRRGEVVLGSQSEIGVLGDQGQGDYLLRQKRRWKARSAQNPA
jgi:cell division cycle 14